MTRSIFIDVQQAATKTSLYMRRLNGTPRGLMVAGGGCRLPNGCPSAQQLLLRYLEADVSCDYTPGNRLCAAHSRWDAYHPPRRPGAQEGVALFLNTVHGGQLGKAFANYLHNKW
eukprot:1506277-Pleurochrysis_carterae.AAC.2